MRMTSLVVVAAVAALVVAPAVGSGTLRVTPTSVRTGRTVTFTGGTCVKGDTVILISSLFPGHAYGVGAITTKARANGHFKHTFTVPRTTAAGAYAITARCGGGNLGVVAMLRVG